MPQLGPLEIAVVLLVALLVFGPNRLPELAKQVGGVLRELRRIQRNIRDDLHDLVGDVSSGAAPPPTLPAKDVIDVAAPIDGSGDDAGEGELMGAIDVVLPARPDTPRAVPPPAPAEPPGKRPLATSAQPSPPPPPPPAESDPA